MNIHYWNSIGDHNNIIDFFDENRASTYLLNTLTKDTPNLLEKYVYDIAMFHFKRLNIVFDENKYIEFWWKRKPDINNIHVDCDEFEKTQNNYIYPLLSCITYLNDHECPTLITNIDMKKYKYKLFEEENVLTLIYPKKNMHVCFDGSNFHGMVSSNNVDLDLRYILAINLWDKKPTNIDYYSSNVSSSSIVSDFTLELNNENETIIVKDKLTYDFYENLFYNKSRKNSKEIPLI